MRKISYLLYLVLLIACKKENEDYPKTYVFDYFETGKVRVFTNDGEITDLQLSSSFIEKWNKYFFAEGSFRFDDFDFKSKITLGANNQSTFQSSDSVIKYGFQLKDGVIYFESSDTSYSSSDLLSMKDGRLRFGPITQTGVEQVPDFSYPPQLSLMYGYLPCAYAIDEGDEIKFPYLSFLEKNCYDDNSESIVGNCPYVSAFSNENNMFNEDYINGIMNKTPIVSGYEYRDTVVIQENFIIYKKQ